MWVGGSAANDNGVRGMVLSKVALLVLENSPFTAAV